MAVNDRDKERTESFDVILHEPAAQAGEPGAAPPGRPGDRRRPLRGPRRDPAAHPVRRRGRPRRRRVPGRSAGVEAVRAGRGADPARPRRHRRPRRRRLPRARRAAAGGRARPRRLGLRDDRVALRQLRPQGGSPRGRCLPGLADGAGGPRRPDRRHARPARRLRLHGDAPDRRPPREEAGRRPDQPRPDRVDPGAVPPERHHVRGVDPRPEPVGRHREATAPSRRGSSTR